MRLDRPDFVDRRQQMVPAPDEEDEELEPGGGR